MTSSHTLRRPRSIFSLERMRSDKRVTWLTIVGLVLVPLMIGGLLVWALWNPTERLGDVKAAVVNLDQPVTLNGQTVPLGRQMAAGLLDSEHDNFTWVLTDAKDADSGMAGGDYVAVVTIPKNFSKAATSTAGAAGKATQATIDVRTSQTSKLVDPAISQAITTTATSVLNKQLTSTYLENVYVGFTTLHDQLSTAATGASQLSGGVAQLASGTHQLGDAAGQLASGATGLSGGISQLSSGVSGLSDGIGQLSGGVSGLSDGIGQLSSGAAGLSDGVGQLSAGAAGLSDGIGRLSGGASSLATGLGTLQSSMGGVQTGAQQLAAGTAGVSDGVARTAAALNAIAASCQGDPVCAQVSAIAEGMTTSQNGQPSLVDAAAQTAAGAQSFSAGMPALSNGIAQSASGAQQLAGGLAQSTTGAQQLAGGLAQSTTGAQQLAGGLAQSTTGAQQLAAGAAQSASGAQQLASGASQSASGAASLADGMTQFAAGIAPLAAGADQSASGAASLASGLDTAVAQLPNYDSGERTNLASVASEPVAAMSSGGMAFGTTSVPLFASVALWLGALASFLVLQAVSRRALLTSRAAGLIALDGLVPAAVLGAVQGVLVAVVMQPAMQLGAGAWFGFAGVATAVGVAFAAVNHGVVALLGGIGRFLSMLVVVVTLASGIVSTAPGFFTSAMAWLPTGPAITALQGAIDGTGDVWRGLGGLLLWAALGFALALAAIARRRIVTVAQLLPAE